MGSAQSKRLRMDLRDRWLVIWAGPHGFQIITARMISRKHTAARQYLPSQSIQTMNLLVHSNLLAHHYHRHPRSSHHEIRHDILHVCLRLALGVGWWSGCGRFGGFGCLALLHDAEHGRAKVVPSLFMRHKRVFQTLNMDVRNYAPGCER